MKHSYRWRSPVVLRKQMLMNNPPPFGKISFFYFLRIKRIKQFWKYLDKTSRVIPFAHTCLKSQNNTTSQPCLNMPTCTYIDSDSGTTCWLIDHPLSSSKPSLPFLIHKSLHPRPQTSPLSYPARFLANHPDSQTYTTYPKLSTAHLSITLTVPLSRDSTLKDVR